MSSELVCQGALLACTFGAAPSTLVVTSQTKVQIGGAPVASITDFAPMTNIPTFGMCSSLANPVVVAATAAALGVLTPMPCVPATTAPWVPGSTSVDAGGHPAVDMGCHNLCMWAGVISVIDAAQSEVTG
jgi:hypothetical protein